MESLERGMSHLGGGGVTVREDKGRSPLRGGGVTEREDMGLPSKRVTHHATRVDLFQGGIYCLLFNLLGLQQSCISYSSTPTKK